MTEGDAGIGDPGDAWAIRDGQARMWVSGAVRGVRSLVESTLGPRGMEAIVETLDNQGAPETVVTGDGGVLLDAIERGDGFNHPAAALFVDAVDSMQRGLHDGTTTAIILTAALAERGFDLIESGVHPGTVTVGYAMAANRAGTVLDDLARPVDPTDVELLADVAATTMTVDVAPKVRDRYAQAVARAVAGLAAASDDGFLDTDFVTVRAAQGEPSTVHRGHVVRRHPAKHQTIEEVDGEFDWSPAINGDLVDASVAVLDREIDVAETASALGGDDAAGLQLTTADAVNTYVTERDERITSVAAGVADLGVDVLVAQPELDREVRTALERHGVAVVDSVQYPQSDVHRVARATGADVVSHVEDLSPSSLGTAGHASERRIGDEKWTYFVDCPGDTFTLVVGADTDTSLTERERLVSDAVEVTAMAAMDQQVLPGAGAPALAVAEALREYAPSVAGKEQLAVEAFADAVEEVVVALVRNGGGDPLDVVADLRVAAGERDGPVGFDPDTGGALDPWEAGVVEPRRVFSQAIETGTATAEQLVTVDDVLYPGVDLGEFAPRIEHD